MKIRKKRIWVAARGAAGASLLALVSACGGGGDGSDVVKEPPRFDEAPQYRALTGISMGAYGALNVGTKHPEGFGTLAALGGPVDLQQLIRDTAESGLEVKPQTEIPLEVGDDFTFDHMPPYPGRDQNLSLIKDLFIALGNPFLHHPDSSRLFLAIDAEPGVTMQDDAFGRFMPPADVRGFLDGGDGDQDGKRQVSEGPVLFADVLLAARGSLAAIAPGAAPTTVGDRDLADLNGDGIYDVGDGIVLNLSEPFTDGDGDGVRDDGEAFQDLGLDGVAGTGDQGEGSGEFDVDPDVANWLAEDPTTRLGGSTAADVSRQRLYLDVGIDDEFGFIRHYENLVGVLSDKGLTVGVQDGFRGGCASLPEFDSAIQLVRYEGGHVGIPTSDDILDELFGGDVCGELVLWRRLQHFFGFLDQSFPDGNYGVGEIDVIDIDFDDFDFDVDLEGLDVRGDLVEADIPSPALQATPDGPIPTRRILAYLPPEFDRSDGDFPVVYFLGGYGTTPSDFRSVSDLLDLLILSDQLQNMFVVFLPGEGGVQGSFFVNHRVPEDQVPDAREVTSGRYEDSIIQDLIPAIERDILNGRVRR
jgi:hypothetical protein